MECPSCKNTANKVIDSRLTKDGISIRRRRQCLACLDRFTTYEATEERLLPILIRNKAGHGVTVTKFQTMLSFISSTLKVLSSETQQLHVKVRKYEKAQAVGEIKSKAVAKTAPEKKAQAKKPDVSRAKALTATDTVLKVIRRHKNGVDISRLKEKTGFNDKKIRNIVHRMRKLGKIKSKGRGIYIKA